MSGCGIGQREGMTVRSTEQALLYLTEIWSDMEHDVQIPTDFLELPAHPAKYPEIIDALALIWENGGSMALENNAFADELIEQGWAKRGEPDHLWRPLLVAVKSVREAESEWSGGFYSPELSTDFLELPKDTGREKMVYFDLEAHPFPQFHQVWADLGISEEFLRGPTDFSTIRPQGERITMESTPHKGERPFWDAAKVWHEKYAVLPGGHALHNLVHDSIVVEMPAKRDMVGDSQWDDSIAAIYHAMKPTLTDKKIAGFQQLKIDQAMGRLERDPDGRGHFGDEVQSIIPPEEHWEHSAYYTRENIERGLLEGANDPHFMAAVERGRLEAAMDEMENVPGASIGWAVHRKWGGYLTWPDYLKPEEIGGYLFGYCESCLRAWGEDWATPWEDR